MHAEIVMIGTELLLGEMLIQMPTDWHLRSEILG